MARRSGGTPPRHVHSSPKHTFATRTIEEKEKDDPDSLNPVYELLVTISPNPLDGRVLRSTGDTSQLWDVRQDTLKTRKFVSRQKRHCFFESHEHHKHKEDKFYAELKDEVFFTWPHEDNNDEKFFRIVMKDALRKFMVSFNRRWPEPHQASKKNKIEHQYERLLDVCDELVSEIDKYVDENPFNVLVCRDWIRSMVLANVIEKVTDITVNERWQVVNCFFETCPFIKALDEPPVFCVEAAGREDFVVTTYGSAPQQHALFVGVPLALQSATGLLYTLELKYNGDPVRRLVMLDPRVPGDAEE
jgi:hypothetical protein